MKSLWLAIQFLTIIPVRIKGTVTDAQIGRCGSFFPLVGALQGALVALALFLLHDLFSTELVSGFAIFVLIATNRGFHLDALADTFDGIGVKSSGDNHADIAKRLSVMKDSATGALGVIAIVLSILLKYLCAGSLFGRYDSESAVYLLFLMPAFSKWAMIPAMAHGKPARTDGLGKVFIEGTGPAVVLASSLVLAAVFFGATLFSNMVAIGSAVLFFLVSIACLYALGLLWALFCGRRFGGLTGDTSGAVAEMADLIFLIVALVFF